MLDRLSSPLRALNGFAAAALVVLGLAAAHCSSGSGGTNDGASCLANPTQCPGGQTCWPTSTTTFACLASDPTGGFGASCVEKINEATCAAGLFCDATDPTGDGQCTQYCNATTACPEGYSCETTHVGTDAGPAVDICRFQAPTTAPSEDGGPIYYVEGGPLPDLNLPTTGGESDGAPNFQ